MSGHPPVRWLCPGSTDDPIIDETTYVAFYVLTSYVMTGEYRPYSLSKATFGRVKPKRNILQGGLRAWEIVARVSYIDLHDAFGIGMIASGGGVQTAGGQELNLTLGINWYLHPHLRVTWNYVLALVDRDIIETDDVGNVIRVFDLDTDHASIFMLRFQVDF
jgi:phosphate-selective porin